MIRICEKCQVEYDDAEQFTFCDHPPLMPEEDMKRKKKAIELFTSRKKVRIGDVVGELTSIDAVGMITIQGQPWLTLFDPLEAVVVEE
jgi:hypothetical protein